VVWGKEWDVEHMHSNHGERWHLVLRRVVTARRRAGSKGVKFGSIEKVIKYKDCKNIK
jgi:hypothetical protein